MLASTDFSESSWTGSGMMEPMYPPAPPTPPAPAPMRDEPMSAPRPKPAKKRKKASRPKAKKKSGKKRPKARAKRGGKRRTVRRTRPRQPRPPTPRGAAPAGRSRGTFPSRRETAYDPDQPMGRPVEREPRSRGRVLGAEGGAGRSCGRDRGDAPAQRRRLEPRGPRRFHERLRARFAHELCLRRTRPVRLAGAVRPIPKDLLCAGQASRLARVQRGAGATPDPRLGALHSAVRAASRRLGDRERTVFPGAAETG